MKGEKMIPFNTVTIEGILDNAEERYTKDGKPFCLLRISQETNEFKVIAFKQNFHQLKKGEPILIQGYLKGSINVRENDTEYENVKIFAGLVRQENESL